MNVLLGHYADKAELDIRFRELSFYYFPELTVTKTTRSPPPSAFTAASLSFPGDFLPLSFSLFDAHLPPRLVIHYVSRALKRPVRLFPGWNKWLRPRRKTASNVFLTAEKQQQHINSQMTSVQRAHRK